MWKTGGPDSSEMATPKRVRTSRPKYSGTIRFFVNGGKIWQIKNQKTSLVGFTAFVK